MSKQDEYFNKITKAIQQLQGLYSSKKSEYFAFKEQLEHVVYELERYMNEAQMFYDDMKDNGLQFSVIEAEGYLRGFKLAYNIAKDAFESANKTEDESYDF